MKVKKTFIAVFAIGIITIIYFFSSGCNLQYMLAEIVYGNQASVDSRIIFSKGSGFYEDEFDLRIYAPSKEIYYTLDGSEPTKDSKRYISPIQISDVTQNENVYSVITDVCGSFLAEDPFYKVPDYPVDKCTIIKAVYYDENGDPGVVEERVYFVGYDKKAGYDNVNIISVTADSEDLFGDEKGIYVLGNTFQEFAKENDINDYKYYRWGANYLNRGREWEREAHIQIFNEKKEPVLSQHVGIRIQGGISRGLLPKSLNLYARKEYGDNKMQYDFFDTGFYPQRVTLSSGGNDYYGKIRDRLGAELTESCEFCTMHYEPYVLFLNGEYWGFYYLTEKYDEHYIEHYYDINAENVLIVKNGNLEVGEDEDLAAYNQMKDFVEYADMTMEENYQMACTLLDIDSFIDYFAAEIYMARQVDWPMANYALWRSRDVSTKQYEDGKWRWMLFDVNTAAFQDYLVDDDTLAFVMQESRMFENLCDNSNFRADFARRLREMADTIFEQSVVEEKILEYEELMAEPMDNHHQRFFGGSNSMFFSSADSSREFAALRKNYIDVMLKENLGE